MAVQTECLALLLSYHLDVDLEDYAGDTAQRIAEIYDHQNCVETVKEHLAMAQLQESKSLKSASPSPCHSSISIRGGREGRHSSVSWNSPASDEKGKKDQKAVSRKKNVKLLNVEHYT